MIGYAIDISHHQEPASLPWEKLYSGAVDLVTARATYGVKADKAVAEHIRRARGIGAVVGLYHFFRPSQPWEAQAGAFERAAILAGINVGDVVPAIDVEADPIPKLAEVSGKWEAPVKQFVEAMRSSFGECIVYITRRDWRALGGAPAWVLERPLWVAHYTLSPTPAAPGDNVCMEPVMWQHRVGSFVRFGPGGAYKAKGIDNPKIDQSRILGPLPLIGGELWDPSQRPTDPAPGRVS